MHKHTLVIQLLLILLLPFCLAGQEVNSPVKSRGVTSYPFPVEVTQPDGSVLTLTRRGDGVINRTETVEGYTVLANSKGFYCYAVRNTLGDLVPSTFLVSGSKGEAPPGIEKHLGYSSAQVDKRVRTYYKESETKYNPQAFPSKGNNSVLMILARFPDLAGTNAQGDFNNLMNAVNYNGTGSFRDFYLETSYDSLALQTTVTAWVEVSQGMGYYGANDAYGFDIRPQEFIREAVDLADASGLDFSQFDNDNDGYVDEVIVIHAGFGEEYLGTGDTCLWSHSWHLGDLSTTYDGVMIDNYLLVPELRGNTGSDITNIGVICHEFGHSLGLPDFYDTDGDGSGGYAWNLNLWDLMADGSWNNDGASPSNNNAWSKSFLGWLDIPELNVPGAYTLNAAGENPEAFRIQSATFNEFFILENRQQAGIDASLPGQGLLIYHIDLNYAGWNMNAINTNPDHQGLDLEEADGITDYITLSGDPYPGSSGNQAFSTSTAPNSLDWSGQVTNIAIQDISLSSGIISFNAVESFPDPLPSEWVVNYSAYDESAKITAMVLLETDTVSNGYLAAFSGNECRGIGTALYDPVSDSHVFELRYHASSPSTDTMSFRYFDAVSDSVYEIYEKMAFIADTETGSAGSPVNLHHYFHYSGTFSPGWNWFSVNVTGEDMSLGTLLNQELSDGDIIKNQTHFSLYYEGIGWLGTLKELDPSGLYKINLLNGGIIDIYGISAIKNRNPINLSAGWNWIGYYPSVSLSLDSALQSITLTQLDLIKNFTKFSSYYEGIGWLGTLKEMHPGEGYMVRVSNPGTLVFPGSTQSSPSKKSVNIPEQGKKTFQVNPHQYEFNGTVMAEVQLAGMLERSESDLLIAFSGTQCRGIAAPLPVPETDKLIYAMMIYSNMESGEKIAFQYYHAPDDRLYPLEGNLTFCNDMMHGDLLHPLELYISASTTTEEWNNTGTPSPDCEPVPFQGSLRIRYTVPLKTNVELKIFDLAGRCLETLVMEPREPGEYEIHWNASYLPAGTYIIGVKTGEEQQMKRIIKSD